MALEVGGRADKYGNRFEYNWTISKLIDVVEEKLQNVVIEALGEDEYCADLWVTYMDGKREAQQCKSRNASLEYWNYVSVNKLGIWEKWKYRLDSDKSVMVSLVSPVSFTMLEDICNRARTNDNAKEFYETQIKKSGKPTNDFFNSICNVMGVDATSESGQEVARDYFSRMYYRQIPDFQLKEINLSRIGRLFVGEPNYVYGVFLNYILNCDVLGKAIDYERIDSYLRSENIVYKNLSRDERIRPALKTINDEYDDTYSTFSCGFIERDQTDKCMNLLLNGESILMHGNAGVGKSGCVENIIRRLKEEKITYLAVRLDRHIPFGNSEKWSQDLGLPASIPSCIDAITSNPAVIILDQLDALRWTQSHSGDALVICLHIIKEVQRINKEREFPISLVFVCRSYDMDNDGFIQKLFEDNTWNRIKISPLSPKEIERVIGNQYYSLPDRTKKLLSLPSNLYIWERLDKGQSYEGIDATYKLIRTWWEQIEASGRKKELESKTLNSIKSTLVRKCYEKGWISVPKQLVDMSKDYEDYLVSSEFIIVKNNKISFVHQSVLDSFFAEEMMKDFYDNKDICSIIGKKSEQTPSRRYQTQILFRQIIDTSIEDYLLVGNDILFNEEIRYSFKCLFIEILSQLDPTVYQSITDYVLDLLDREEWRECVISNVISGNSYYVHLLRDRGDLDKWISDPSDKKNTIELVASIRTAFDVSDVSFIKKYVMGDSVIDDWRCCFLSDIGQDIDEFFELRLEVYDKYPSLIKNYMDISELIHKCPTRMIRLLPLMIKADISHRDSLIYKCAEDICRNDSGVFDDNYREILDLLLPTLPGVDEDYYRWSGRFIHSNSIERACVLFVKLATRKLAINDPQCFWNTYSFAFDKGNDLYNEIILDGLLLLDDNYSEYIIDYIVRNSFVNAIEDTSNNGNKLLLTKGIIGKYTMTCSASSLEKLEMAILEYKDPTSKEIYRMRLEENKHRRGEGESLVCWPFYGDLQYELLSSICENRIGVRASAELRVLKRKFENTHSKYIYNYHERCLNVVSPVSGKNLNANDWVRIITNPNIKFRGKTIPVYEEGICIEHSLEEYMSSFIQFVSSSPLEITRLLEEEVETVHHDGYIDSYFSGLSDSKDIDSVAESSIVKVIKKYGYDYESYRAATISDIIERIRPCKDQYLISVLWDIAFNHRNPQLEVPVVVIGEDKECKRAESLESNAINCVRGRAIRALSKCIRDDESFFEDSRERINMLANDANPIIRFATLFLLESVVNYDAEWAINLIVHIYKSDYRMMGYYHSRNFFVRLYSDCSDFIRGIIMKSLSSDDERLKRTAGYSIVDLYMHKDAFENIYDLYIKSDSHIRNAMLEMIIEYFEGEQYRNKSKALLERLILIEDDNDNDYLWGRLFVKKLLNSERDSMFIKDILGSRISRTIVSFFCDFVLEEKSIFIYADEVLDIGLNIVRNPTDYYYWGTNNELLRLIIGLYDETANSDKEEFRSVADRCLDVWDAMYENNLGIARELSEKLLDL